MKKVPWRILFVRELLSFYISKKLSLKNILLSLLMWPESIFVLYINECINEVDQKLRYNLFWYRQQHILAHHHCATDGKMKESIGCLCFSKRISSTHERSHQTISIPLLFYSFYLLPNLLLDAVFNDDCQSKNRAPKI